MPDQRSISFVLPVFNEERNLAALLHAIAKEMNPFAMSYAFTIVDDGSTDKTWATVAELRAQFPTIRAIRLSRNFGKEAALAAGLELAAGDAVIVMDADMQHPTRLIAEMLRLWEGGNVDVVEAVKRSRGRESLFYKACSKSLYLALAQLTAMDMDGVSDFCLDAKVIRAWRCFGETNLFFRGLSVWLGFRRTRVYFDVSARASGRSAWTFQRLVRLALTSITAFSSLPLHAVTLMGGCFFLFATVLGTRAVYLKLHSDTVIDGVTTVILLILFVGSLLMIALGVIGEYIAQIYNEVKRRPRYVVAERMGETQT